MYIYIQHIISHTQYVGYGSTVSHMLEMYDLAGPLVALVLLLPGRADLRAVVGLEQGQLAEPRPRVVRGLAEDPEDLLDVHRGIPQGALTGLPGPEFLDFAL